MTPDQIKKAKNRKQANYSDDIAAQLGLTSTLEASPENPEEQPHPKIKLSPEFPLHISPEATLNQPW